MANDKDFLLKNAVEVGGPTNVTLGTVTSGTVDLSTGNYFSDTLAANTTYAFSNAGDVQSFQLEVTGGSIETPYSIADFSYTSKTDPSADASLKAFRFKPDGTRLYELYNYTTETVKSYTLSTAWDISTLSDDSKSVSVNGQDTDMWDLDFSSDGTKMYVGGATSDRVYQYDLSTAWDVSTATYNSVNLVIASQETVFKALKFKPDGTKLYVIGENQDKIYQYGLSTAWDLSTASWDSVVTSITFSDAHALDFSSDGTKLIILNRIGDSVMQYTMSTAWDLSTVAIEAAGSTGGSNPATPYHASYADSGKKIILAGDGSFYEYSILNTVEATITWPTSIEWAGGISPAAPATGETDLFTFSTDDGGTSYIGLKTADNLS